jgi:hypothetical protein
MTWADTVREQFDLVDHFTTDETEYYGPYNTLLTDIFPHAEHFQIVPQYKGPITPGSIDFTTIYIVRKRKCPVFFIEIKPFPHLDDISTREKADQQMRDRFVTIIGRTLVIPKLYGISAMGTRFSVYEYNQETNMLLPPSIARDAMYVTDVAPAERWNYELLEDDGEKKMRELVVEVKAMCETIKACACPRLLRRSLSMMFAKRNKHCFLSLCARSSLNFSRNPAFRLFRASPLSVHEYNFS